MKKTKERIALDEACRWLEQSGACTHYPGFMCDKEFSKDPWTKEMHFISSAQGRFGIFGYDCSYHELLRGDMTMKDSLIILEGRYGVFNGFYKVAFVKWED